MLAKRTIKRAEARCFHISKDFNREASPKSFKLNCYHWRTEADEYNHINELNERQRELVEYLDRLRSRANIELYRLKRLPLWKRIFMA